MAKLYCSSFWIFLSDLQNSGALQEREQMRGLKIKGSVKDKIVKEKCEDSENDEKIKEKEKMIITKEKEKEYADDEAKMKEKDDTQIRKKEIMVNENVIIKERGKNEGRSKKEKVKKNEKAELKVKIKEKVKKMEKKTSVKKASFFTFQVSYYGYGKITDKIADMVKPFNYSCFVVIIGGIVYIFFLSSKNCGVAGILCFCLQIIFYQKIPAVSTGVSLNRITERKYFKF